MACGERGPGGVSRCCAKRCHIIMPAPKSTPKSKRPFMPPPSSVAAVNRDMRALAREYGPDVIAKYWQLMNDPKVPHVVQLGAANALADRGWGKPAQTVSHRVIHSLGDLTDEELNNLLVSEGEIVDVAAEDAGR